MPSSAMDRCSDRNQHVVEATMIQGTNVNIRYANLSMSNHQVNEAKLDGANGLDLLRSNCSLPALVDAKQRYDSPRCTEATRRNIMQKLEDWVRDDTNSHGSPSSIFWLYGGAGVGKSALAQTLAEKFKTNGDLAASFFFFKADVNRNDGDRLIPTLALQLVRTFQGLTPFLEDKILQNPDLFEKGRRTQMLDLLIEPLIRLSLEETDGVQSNTELKSHPRLIVIDGLDECLDSKIQCDLIRIIASAIPHSPYPLRLLITSRSESHITRVFEHDVGKMAQYNLSDDSDADQDIRNFLKAEFTEIHRTHPLRRQLLAQWPHWDAISSIVERSSGHFIYASTVIRFIRSPKHRPDDRLQVILGLRQPYEKDRPYARLDELYRLIFLEIQDPGEFKKIHRALGIIHLRSLESGLLAWPQWTSDGHAIEALLELRPGDLVLLFDPLLSLVTFEKNGIRIFHKSLFDYLLDSSRSGDLLLDLGLAHEAAANYIVRPKKIPDNWDSVDFQNIAYHCQFAPLNGTLTSHLLFLACDPNITFTNSSSRLRVLSEKSYLLHSIFYFVQVISRQDFDSSGHRYRMYVEKKDQRFRSVVPLSQRLNYMVFRLTHLEEIRTRERIFRLSFEEIFAGFALKCVQLGDTNGLIGRAPIPTVTTSIVKSIQQEHEMFSSCLKVQYRYPEIVLSSFESMEGLIHSCHYVIDVSESVVQVCVTFAMLVTYTKHGVRLSCTEFEGKGLHARLLVEEHLQNTEKEVRNNHRKVYMVTPHKKYV